MPALFVAGTGTDVGKTYVTAALLRALKAAGHAVDALKPVVSGFDPASPQGSDPAVLLRALGRPLTPETLAEMSPWRFGAPLAPDQAAALEGRALLADEVIALCQQRMTDAGDALLVIESAGGIMSPLDSATTMLDLAAALQAPVLLVTGAHLGAISHTLTAARVLADAGLTPAATAVSETASEPPFELTLAALSQRLAPIAVFGVTQGGSCPEGLARLALRAP